MGGGGFSRRRAGGLHPVSQAVCAHPAAAGQRRGGWQGAQRRARRTTRLAPQALRWTRAERMRRTFACVCVQHTLCLTARRSDTHSWEGSGGGATPLATQQHTPQCRVGGGRRCRPRQRGPTRRRPATQLQRQLHVLADWPAPALPPPGRAGCAPPWAWRAAAPAGQLQTCGLGGGVGGQGGTGLSALASKLPQAAVPQRRTDPAPPLTPVYPAARTLITPRTHTSWACLPRGRPCSPSSWQTQRWGCAWWQTPACRGQRARGPVARSLLPCCRPRAPTG